MCHFCEGFFVVYYNLHNMKLLQRSERRASLGIMGSNELSFSETPRNITAMLYRGVEGAS